MDLQSVPPRRRGPTGLLVCVAVVLSAAGSDWSPPAAQGLTSNVIRIGVVRDGKYDVVTLPLETYVARVLVGEALPDSRPAALEALAIAVRTYTLANRGRHRADGFDLCDQTHCQVMRTSSLATERAALATAGKSLLYLGALASVYYSASSGGRTEKPSNVWPGADDPPYLPSRADDGCGGSPAWSAELTLNDMQRALDTAGYRGTLRSVRLGGHNESGRVATLLLDGLTPAQISGQDLRVAVGRTLGWQRIQSTTFELKRVGDAYRFTGRGAGHGVGMCVIGSAKLAIAGRDAAEILARYFPGTEIGVVGPRLTAVPPPSIRVPSTAPSAPLERVQDDVTLVLPDGEQGERSALTTMVRRERDRIAGGLGVPSPTRVVIRFHPTVDAYERATQQPWFTFGAVVGMEIHTVPLATLRQRDLLERTVRRQLVHLIVDGALEDRSAWVREGAASYFADGTTGTATRASCPRDPELQEPISAGAFNEALGRARSCFERQLTAGRSWRDVK